jgi:hypothetical protein
MSTIMGEGYRTPGGPFAERRAGYMAQVRRISWAAVFAGVILAMGIHLLLSVLGTGIGVSTIDPVQQTTPDAKVLGVSAGIWWAVSSLIALFVGGWVASYLAGIPRSLDGILHGLLTWGLATLLAFIFIGSAVGTLVGGALNLTGTIGKGAAGAVSAVAPQIADAAKQKLAESDLSWNDITKEAGALLSQTGKPALQPDALKDQSRQAAAGAERSAENAAAQPGNAGNELDSILDRLLRSGQSAASQVDRDAAINVIVARTGKSREEASRIVQNWESTYAQAKSKAKQTAAGVEQQAREATTQGAKALSTASLWGFFALLLGAVAAGLGGFFGKPRRVVTVNAPLAAQP